MLVKVKSPAIGKYEVVLGEKIEEVEEFRYLQSAM